MAIEISLAPDGAINLHLPLHTVKLPMGEAGVALLRHILQGQANGARKLTEQGNPSQWDVDLMLKAMSSDSALQLAGNAKRWKAIEDRTGVRIQKASRSPQPAALDGLDIGDLL